MFHQFTFTIMTHTTNTFKTYKLMYQFGAWLSKETFAAESDAEAIFDADAIFNSDKALQNWNYKVALWCGNRMVKQYR